MGFSSVVVEAIIMMSAVIAASMLASVIVSKVNVINDAFQTVMREKNRAMLTRIAITYATYDDTSGLFIVYATNIGSYAVSAMDKINIYFGEYGHAAFYTYDRDGILSPGEWSYIEPEGEKPNVWEPGETIEFIIYNSTAVNMPYYVKIVLPSGSQTDEIFTDIRA